MLKHSFPDRERANDTRKKPQLKLRRTNRAGPAGVEKNHQEIYRPQPNLRSKATLSVTYKSGIPIENLISHRRKDYMRNRIYKE